MESVQPRDWSGGGVARKAWSHWHGQPLPALGRHSAAAVRAPSFLRGAYLEE